MTNLRVTMNLQKNFMKPFQNELKEIFVDSVSKAKEERNLSTFQIQAVMKLIEKNREIRDSSKIGNLFLC